MGFDADVVIVGGCGHAGLPLGLAFAARNLHVLLYDINKESVDRVNAGLMPFSDEGADEILRKVLSRELLSATGDSSSVSQASNVVLVVGTPVDEHLNPNPRAVSEVVENLADRFVDGQILILRSTVYPGVTASVERQINRLNKSVGVAFCPERTAEGRAMIELFELPQIVASRSEDAADRAEKLFKNISEKVIRLSPEEAELAKLFTNSWRYIKFATANQLFMMANDFGLDFERIRNAITEGYPRAHDMPTAGFAAGPCLFKDTAQLAAFNNNNFLLGHAAMMVNEGLPLYLVSKLEQQYDLSEMAVGILGMAFKAESDDMRSSLSYKLKRILSFKAARVLCTDPYVSDPTLDSLDDVLEGSDLLIIGAPHRRYSRLSPDVPLVDVWNLFGKGVIV